MKQFILKIVLVLQFLNLPLFKGQPSSSIHQFTATSIDGQTIDFASFKGKKLLIVNTASECGLTPQFQQLQELYTKYQDQNFMIIGFPSNDFAHQEPGNNSEIKAFCQRNYGVTFLMMQKIDVKGDHTHPIYQWLTSKSKNGVMSSHVKWNFQKYMIDENGYLVNVVSPWKKPDSSKILKWIHSKK